MQAVRKFGEVGGAGVFEVTLRSEAGAEAKIISYGAVVRDLLVPTGARRQRVVLGFDRLGDYLAHSPYFGAIAGRYANRIAGGRFRIGQQDYALSQNEGENHLHGGLEGFSRRVWQFAGSGPSWVALTLVSPDGDQGYPGNLTTTCLYRLAQTTLRIELVAMCDAVTPVNLCHHSYFNLDGSASILDHRLRVDADFYTPVDATLIPTGEIRSVAATPYDFRAGRPARRMGPEGSQDYDVNFVLNRARLDRQAVEKESRLAPLAFAAALSSEASGLSMQVWTTEPGLQVYDGHLLQPAAPGLDGARYGANAGLCLEPQHFPDSPNRPHFPDTLLWPGQVYRQVTEYRFSPQI